MALKDEGNQHFKTGDYPKAIAAYHQIFMYVHGYSVGSSGSAGMPGQTSVPVSAEEMAQIKELKLTHFNNLAMCHLKKDNWQKAHTNCTKALELDPKNVKALFRRGKCNAQLGHLDEAKEDLDQVIQLQPDNKEAVRELRGLKAGFAAQRKRELKKFAGMFDKLQADEEQEASAAAAASSAAASSSAGSSGGSAGASACANPEAISAAAAAAAAMVDDDEDIGEPLGAPQTFEPSDVLYKGPAGEGLPVPVQ